MKISEHADHTQKICGLRAEDIHKWIDGYFDRESFEYFIESGKKEGYDPYNHRQFRHCSEALADAVKEFSYKYSAKEIECVFECHIKDDYNGYIPTREDFANGRFREKYHESGDESETILTPKELDKYFKGLRYKSRDEKKGKNYINSFSLRIALPSAASILLLIAAVFFFILPLFHDSLMAEKEEMLEEISSLAVSILQYYAGLETSGALSGEEARAASINEIGKLRYGPDNDNYFWITDMQPVMIMHPWRADLVGTDLRDYTDSMNRSGKRLFVESVELVQASGGGFLEYLWQLDESDSRTVLKLSRVEGFIPWGWIIGTGIYVDDVEDEISRLTKQLLLVLLIISGALAAILAYLIFQSLKIEQSRTRAETGLIEAKERYRALVEASNEGYLMIMNGQNVFSNPTFSRITGFSEDEILESDFNRSLFPEIEQNRGINQILEKISGSPAGPEEYEAVIKCSSGALLDVIVRVSRIFLPEDNGIIISFRQILEGRLTVSPLFSNEVKSKEPSTLIKQLEESTTAINTVRILNQLPTAVRTMVVSGSPSPEIRLFITAVYNEGLKKLASFAEEELGTPPVEYTFLSLGSSGRGEMTLFSDQDNALVFRAGDLDTENLRLYFLNLAGRICSLLNQAGFPYCPGGIMAINPSYCLSLGEWKKRYRNWFGQADSIALLDIHVFFDITAAWGSAEIVEELYDFIFREINNKAQFLAHFARNCLSYKAPQGMLGSLRTEMRNGTEVINLKETLIPLMNYARISALKEGITISSTLGRLQILHQNNKLDTAAYDEMIRAFEILWRMRFSNQIFAHGELRKINDDLDPSALPEENYKDLKEAVSIIAATQSRLSYEFLGVDLS